MMQNAFQKAVMQKTCSNPVFTDTDMQYGQVERAKLRLQGLCMKMLFAICDIRCLSSHTDAAQHLNAHELGVSHDSPCPLCV